MAQPPVGPFASLPQPMVPAVERLTPSPSDAQLGQSVSIPFAQPIANFREMLRVATPETSSWTLTVETLLEPSTVLTVAQDYIVILRVRYGSGGTQHTRFLRVYPFSTRIITISATSVFVDILGANGTANSSIIIQASLSPRENTGQRARPFAQPIFTGLIGSSSGNIFDRGTFLPPCELTVFTRTDAGAPTSYELVGYNGFGGTGTIQFTRTVTPPAEFGLPIPITPITRSVRLFNHDAANARYFSLLSYDPGECNIFP